jgi:hypothetical protein
VKYRKAFEQKEYDEQDARAKEAVRKYLDSIGVYTLIQEDYGVDIKSYRPANSKARTLQMSHEVEVKKGWIGAWPSHWDTVQIPERKRRLLDCGNIVFWVLKNTLTEAWMIKSELLADSLVKVVPNNIVKAHEKFYCIPISVCKKIKL